MPSGGIHLCVGKRVADRLNIRHSMEFYIGVVSADSWRNSSSTKLGTHFLDGINSTFYRYDLFFDKYSSYMDNDFVLGYLIHLITDKYWYSNNFITSNIYEEDYDDLKKLCSSLVDFYDIPKLYLPSSLDNPISELDSSGISHTVCYLNSVNYIGGVSENFDIELVKECIEKTSDFVVSEINRLR